MADVVAAIEAYNRGRDPALLALKLAKMRGDAFAFLRGSCHLFYASLPGRALFADTPWAWACGDLHLENCGSYRGDNDQVYFDINDFDESVLAPASWDLVRVVASLLVARHDLGISLDCARTHACALIDAYTQALSRGVARWLEREIAVPPVQTLLDAARQTRPRDLLAQRTRGKADRRRLRVDGGKALPASASVVRKVKRFFAGHVAQGGTRFKVLDVARRIAGTGSLGVERYVVLARQNGKDERPLLLDLKAALPPCAQPRSRRAPAFVSDAERIVRIQDRMQAVPIEWLAAVEVEGTAFVLRRLLPSEDRISVRQLRRRPKPLRALLRDIGSCLAWDQLRASGRQGSSTADDLIAYGSEAGLQKRLLSAAEAAAQRVERDHVTFARAYEQGAFVVR